MRYKCIVSYDGSAFHGFQVQGNLRTVQDEIEKVILIIAKKKIRIHSAGRTDTGVHAFGQVFHFDTTIEMGEWNMQNALNSRLPRDIYIRDVKKVDQAFHSRFSAVEKTYHYLIDVGEYNPIYAKYRYFYPYPIDIEQLKNALSIFIGTHDFKTFTKNHKLTDTVRTIHDITLIQQDTLITLVFRGNGFMHNMVRIIVAMLLEVARGKLNIEELKTRLEEKNRRLAPKTAPAEGLYLIKVDYQTTDFSSNEIKTQK